MADARIHFVVGAENGERRLVDQVIDRENLCLKADAMAEHLARSALTVEGEEIRFGASGVQMASSLRLLKYSWISRRRQGLRSVNW